MHALTPPGEGHVRFDLTKSLWLWGMAVPGLVIGLPAIDLHLGAIALTLGFVTLCLGHSVGLHRGAIHHTYEAGPVVRAVLAELFVLTGLGGPLSWARLHAVRDLYQNEPECPRYFGYRHSMARDFWWNLHLRFEPRSWGRFEARLPAATLEDRWLGFLERTWPLHVLALALVIGATLGPEAVAVIVCLRTTTGILGHWAIGYASHVWGERRHTIDGAAETGTNNWLLGVVSFGEGFHNNHHAFPHSARMGQRGYEVDLGFVALKVLERLGAVRDVRYTTAHERPADTHHRLDGGHRPARGV
ncbi:MAG: acyl-CoA desaturase [Myxococcaceae bacterium]|nr:acyl-CoA desaturase [Myxococcaceae bacterium]